MSDFFQQLRENAERLPTSLAIASPTGQLSYRFLVSGIDAVAANAAAVGIRPGETILVLCSNNEARLPLIFGLMRMGATVAVVPSPNTFIENNVRVDKVVTDNPGLKAPWKIVHISPHWFKMPSTDKSVDVAGIDYRLIFTSSGSTGKKKLIRFSRENVEYSIKTKIDDEIFSGWPRYYSTAGSSTFPTFVDFMITLIRGGLIIIQPDRSATSMLDTISLLRPTHVSMAPTGLVMVLKSLRDEPRRFEKVDYIRLSGAYCSIETLEKAAELLANDIFMGYSATEIGRVAVGSFADLRQTQGLVGRIIDAETIVETVDEEGKPLPTGSVGEIRIKPPQEAVASYLIGMGAASPLRDGWFYPGDLGYVTSDRNLFFTGRKSLVMNLGGTKVSPEIAESALQKMAAVVDVGVLAVPDRNGFDVACAAIVKKGNLDLNEINQHLLREGHFFEISKLQFVSSIPRTESGKVDRTGLKTLVG